MLTIQAQSNVPNDFGMFTVYAFSENENDWSPHLVWVAEKTDLTKLLTYVSIQSALPEKFFIRGNVNAGNNWIPQ